MINNELGLFYKFMKIKPLVFKGIEFEDEIECLIDCYEYLYKMGIVERHGMDLVSFKL